MAAGSPLYVLSGLDRPGRLERVPLVGVTTDTASPPCPLQLAVGVPFRFARPCLTTLVDPFGRVLVHVADRDDVDRASGNGLMCFRPCRFLVTATRTRLLAPAHAGGSRATNPARPRRPSEICGVPAPVTLASPSSCFASGISVPADNDSRTSGSRCVFAHRCAGAPGALIPLAGLCANDSRADFGRRPRYLVELRPDQLVAAIRDRTFSPRCHLRGLRSQDASSAALRAENDPPGMPGPADTGYIHARDSARAGSRTLSLPRVRHFHHNRTQRTPRPAPDRFVTMELLKGNAVVTLRRTGDSLHRALPASNNCRRRAACAQGRRTDCDFKHNVMLVLAAGEVRAVVTDFGSPAVRERCRPRTASDGAGTPDTGARTGRANPPTAASDQYLCASLCTTVPGLLPVRADTRSHCRHATPTITAASNLLPISTLPSVD